MDEKEDKKIKASDFYAAVAVLTRFIEVADRNIRTGDLQSPTIEEDKNHGS
jgi:hypothetical protein